MSALLITLLRFGFLALLWLFVFAVVLTVRRDTFGTSVRSRNKSAQTKDKKTKRQQPSTPRQSSPLREPVLVVTDGPLAGTRLPLNSSSVTVGRSPDCSLVLDDGYASSRHARFYRNGDRIVIEDLSSTNGTWINGVKITQPTALPPSTPVTIGKTIMEVQA